MKLELIIFLITVFVLANTYFEGKLLNKLKQYQKYYKMALFAFIGLCAGFLWVSIYRGGKIGHFISA